MYQALDRELFISLSRLFSPRHSICKIDPVFICPNNLISQLLFSNPSFPFLSVTRNLLWILCVYIMNTFLNCRLWQWLSYLLQNILGLFWCRESVSSCTEQSIRPLSTSPLHSSFLKMDQILDLDAVRSVLRLFFSLMMPNDVHLRYFLGLLVIPSQTAAKCQFND